MIRTRFDQFLLNRRTLLAAGGGGLVAGAAALAFAREELPTINVTDRRFGADPSGQRNSTSAFQAAARMLAAAGGGRLLIPRGDYRVGRQSRALDNHWSFAPEPIIELKNCVGRIEIEGSGARLFADPGLRFGSFDRVSGRRMVPRLPFTDTAYRASPYIAMIALYGNRGPVVVRGLELDGNSGSYAVGGPWNDHGIQINNSGIEAYGNADLTIEDVYSHHHGLDGIMIGFEGLREGAPRYPHTLVGCRFEDNGRQGLSWVGGNDLRATDCTFSRSGRGAISSSPGAGVDIEAEASICRNGRFEQCTFSDNAGVGLVAHAASDNADIFCRDCRFVGTTTWAAWPTAPKSSFKECVFVGGVTNAHADKEPSFATRFANCRFTADPSLAPRGQVYAQNYLTVEMDTLENVRFDGCRFDSPGNLSKGLIYANGGRFTDCGFEQDGPGLAVLRGLFAGRCTITTAGTIDFSGARFAAPVIVNGRRVS